MPRQLQADVPGKVKSGDKMDANSWLSLGIHLPRGKTHNRDCKLSLENNPRSGPLFVCTPVNHPCPINSSMLLSLQFLQGKVGLPLSWSDLCSLAQVLISSKSLFSKGDSLIPLPVCLGTKDSSPGERKAMQSPCLCFPPCSLT